MGVSMRSHPLGGRSSGLLLHPTSLPGPHGIGDLGAGAREFLDFLESAGQSIWQVLPLGPVGSDGSPYQSTSSHAGNPALVDLQALVDEGWLGAADLAEATDLPQRRVSYRRVLPWKLAQLEKAARAFARGAGPEDRQALERFREEASGWLGPYADFMARKEAHRGAAWTEWDGRVADAERVRFHEFVQFQFYRQWEKLRAECRRRGVRLIGDLPIYVAHDSIDVFRSKDLFDLDPEGRPRHVAGAPPDYFSADGQLWGNPLYRWDVMARDGFHWWIDRLAWTLRLVDVVRIDHFRGLQAYYEIPAGAPDARSGRWVEAPGEALLTAAERALGGLPFIAEDLGYITPEVEALRDRFELPGMRVLQFAFGDEDGRHPFRPHNYVAHSVAYTGTHDNDTTVGWYRGRGGVSQAGPEVRAERERALRYLGGQPREIHWAFIRGVLGSVSRTAVIPVQDLLGLGSSARLNLPASRRGNWSWRCAAGALRPDLAERLRELTRLYGR